MRSLLVVMRKENNYYSYNFKNMLIKVLEMLGLDKNNAQNTVLIQDISAFLLDMNYPFFDLNFCISMMESNPISMDKFISYYNDETDKLYNYLKKFIYIKDNYNCISIERISSEDDEYNSKYISCVAGDKTYYKGDIKSIINDKIKYMRDRSMLLSRKIVIFVNSNYTVRYVTKYEIAKRVIDYNIHSAKLACHVEEDVETYNGNRVIRLDKSVYRQIFNDFDLTNPIKLDCINEKNCIQKKIYSVNNNMLDFNLMNDGGYYSNKKLNIKFSVPLSYDIWSFDFYNIDMNLYEENDYESVRKFAKEIEYSCSPKDEFIINTSVYSANMDRIIENKLEDELYNIYNGRQYRK